MDASTYDEICVYCGATDVAGGGWGRLAYPCPATEQARREERWGDKPIGKEKPK